MSNQGDQICFKKSRYIIYRPYVGLHLAYHAKRFLFTGKSKYQKVDIIENEAYGRMLFLDSNVQHTEYDARAFNEALCGFAKISGLARLIVLGGGSGQTVMSLLDSESVKHVKVIEIDKMVVEACQRHIKGVRQAFDDPRVRIVIGDAFSYVHEMREHFDGAIIDFTELPFRLKSNLKLLRQLYADIRVKCGGRCSQYIGSSVGLAYGPRLRKLADTVATQYLSTPRYQEVFIPSFGAPHTFLHAGYD